MPDQTTPPQKPEAMPPVKPLTPAPAEPSVRPEATPHDPSVAPHPERSSTPLKIALVALLALLLGGITFLIIWPRLSAPSQAPVTPPTTETNHPSVPPLEEAPTTAPTTTSETPTTAPTVPADETPTITRGSSDVWFAGDEKIVKDATTGHLWSVKAIEFGDSRCPQDVVCIWAGERTVTIDVKDLSTGRTERVTLGTSRGRTANVNGLTLNLVEIDDGKGGVYAEIKVD